MRCPNGSAPGWWGAAREASGGGGGLGMVRKKVRERATAQLANLIIYPLRLLPLDRGELILLYEVIYVCAFITHLCKEPE